MMTASLEIALSWLQDIFFSLLLSSRRKEKKFAVAQSVENAVFETLSRAQTQSPNLRSARERRGAQKNAAKRNKPNKPTSSTTPRSRSTPRERTKRNQREREE